LLREVNESVDTSCEKISDLQQRGLMRVTTNNSIDVQLLVVPGVGCLFQPISKAIYNKVVFSGPFNVVRILRDVNSSR